MTSSRVFFNHLKMSLEKPPALILNCINKDKNDIPKMKVDPERFGGKLMIAKVSVQGTLWYHVLQKQTVRS